MPTDDHQPKGERARKMSDADWLRLFFLPVFLLGAGGFAVVTIWPLVQILDARHWPETPCVVESSQVVAHQGDESTSYSIEVVYHYHWNDRPYTSSRYNFVIGSWSGYRAKQAVVAQYQSGRETVCFVNPKAPEKAVLNRGWQPEMGMGGLGLLFALAGGLVLVCAGKIVRAKSSAETHLSDAAGTGGSDAHKSEYTPLGRCYRILIGALLWNGFIGFIAYFLFFVEDRANVELGPRIIIGLFLLVGVFLLIEAFTQFLALFKPPATRARAKSKKR